MGWLEGLLTGYANQMGDIRRQNAAEAERSASREGDIYKTLLNSEDPEIRGMAATGLLSASQPKKLKSGFSGWMGEMQGNPMYPQLMKYITTPKQLGEDVSTTVTTPEKAGYMPTLPDTSQPAAQSTNKTTTPGAPGPQPTQATPAAGPPPPPSSIGVAGMASAAGAPAAAGAEPPPAIPPEMLASLAGPTSAVPGGGIAEAPPPPPPSIAQVGLDQLRSQLGPETKPAPLRQTTRTPIIGLPHAFPTAEENEITQARAKGTGEYQSWVDIGRRAGQPNPEQWAADQMVAEKIRRSGGLSARSVTGQTTMPDGSVQPAFRIFDASLQAYIDPVTRQPDPHFRPISAVGMGQYFERAAAAAGYGRGSMVPDWDVPNVQAAAEEMAQSEAGARTAGTRQARAPMLPAEALTAARQLLPNASLDQITQLADSLMKASQPAATPAAPATAASAAAAAPTPAPAPAAASAAAPATSTAATATAAATPTATAGPTHAVKQPDGSWAIMMPDAPGAAGAPPATGTPAPAAGTGFNARVTSNLPPGAGAQTREAGKPMAPALANTVSQAESTNTLIDRALAALAPYKNDNTPQGSINLASKYREGVYDPVASAAAQLSDLAGLQAKNSAALSSGGTRAWQYIVQKSQHVPRLPSSRQVEFSKFMVPTAMIGSVSRLIKDDEGGWDSPQMIYHKLEQVRQNNEQFLKEMRTVRVPQPAVVGQPPPRP